MRDKEIRVRPRSFGFVISACSLIILMGMIGLLYDYYYEFNDDVLIKDILAGIYTGTPESHNIQMLWLISVCISSFYQLTNVIPWFGLFLCGCQYLAIFLVTNRVQTMVSKKWEKLLTAGGVVLLLGSVMLEHLVFVQYTITVAFLASAACFLFVTSEKELTGTALVKENLGAIVLLFLGFLIRPEMLLLMLPFVGAAGLYHWSLQKKPFGKACFLGYFSVIGLIFLCLVIGHVSNALAYRDPKWQEFSYLFDQRTQLYDYQYVPAFDEHADFYREIGMEKAEQKLLENYNFGLSPEIDGALLEKVQVYADQSRPEDHLGNVIRSVKEYGYNIMHLRYGIFDMIVWMCYLFLGAAILLSERSVRAKIGRFLFCAGSIFFCRSVSWLYIVMGRRAPDRITHSLYLIEILLLMAVCFMEWKQKQKSPQMGKIGILAINVLLVLVSVIGLPQSVSKVSGRTLRQEEINQYGQAIHAYCMSHPENFYLEDVYSTIYEGESFNQKMFRDVNTEKTNYDLLGGWFAKSPLYEKKLAGYGIFEPEKDFLDKDNLFLICELSSDVTWITDYYASQEIAVEISLVDEIIDLYGVYQIRRH